jgi:hypothetical protein
MSCITQNQQPVRFIVTMGALPEGFCGTPQELAQAIADRLIIQANPFNSSFATGSVAPTSNIGPWLKDCEEWYVWDDATGQYIPMRFSWGTDLVGCAPQSVKMSLNTAVPTGWTDIIAITTSTLGGVIQIHAQGTLRFPISGGLDFAFRLFDGAVELTGASIEIDGVTPTTADVPFSLHFSETLAIGVAKTYTLQASASAGGGTLLETATKGGVTVTGMTRMDSLQFFKT